MGRKRGASMAGKARGVSPGGPAGGWSKGLGSRGAKMGEAEGHRKSMDPSGARQAARQAADALQKAREEARGAARQRQSGSDLSQDHTVHIPGADQYKAPESFREDILEAMKKRGAQHGGATGDADDYDDMIERYYRELIK